MDATPSVFTPGYTHRGDVLCPACDGDKECGICKGKGTVTRGCGGPAERDEHYGTSYCLRCGHMVDPAEVT